ncbi:unnamed protein product [Acidithrix sp. C25]|nr:unnamed protein product [Acidithrix sp. C25]
MNQLAIIGPTSTAPIGRPANEIAHPKLPQIGCLICIVGLGGRNGNA